MGRTNPTFRDAFRRFDEDWAPFRRALRRQYREDFEDLLAGAEAFADAAGYQNATDPERAIFLSMLLAHQGDLRDLEDRLSALEERLSALEAAVADDAG